jgi:hypothetical protein
LDLNGYTVYYKPEAVDRVLAKALKRGKEPSQRSRRKK